MLEVDRPFGLTTEIIEKNKTSIHEDHSNHSNQFDFIYQFLQQ